MRPVLCAALFAVACSSPAKKATTPTLDPTGTPAPTQTAPASVTKTYAEDTPVTDTDGNTFIAPAGWTTTVTGAMTVLSPPEKDSWIALVDVSANTAEEALALAWKQYKPTAKWSLLTSADSPDRFGWSKIKSFEYQTSPNEKRAVQAQTVFANGRWLVLIIDIAEATAEKRAGQLGTAFSRLFPKGYSRESFAGKTAAKLDAAKIDALKKFVSDAMETTKVPGVAFGIVQDGKTVFAGGLGVRELGKPEKVDQKTLFMIASNTKALTTLMLARLVDQKKLSWTQPVTEVLPTFKLGDPAVTKQVLVKHLICACTGMPRQDLEWLLEWKGSTPESILTSLGTMVPTSKFGELFQYSNLMAAAGGYTGAHALYPKLELGAAYDKAMQTQVFGPLGMTSTTFDYARALKANHAMPAGIDVDGKAAPAVMDENYSIISARPAGAAWSNVEDMLAYVQMELSEGKTRDGKPYVSKEALLERRRPNVAISADAAYGMGLMVGAKYEVPVVHHGGDLIGYHSDMIWLPEANVGAVILTNGDLGRMIRDQFQRKLLELLYDGKPEADENVAAGGKTFFTSLVEQRKLITVPADPAAAKALAKKYQSTALGQIAVAIDPKTNRVTFDFGEFKSEVASMKNPDGTTTFLTIAPGLLGFGFVVGTADGKPTLVTRDGQHEYVFTAM